ncbi:NADPH-dependent FMN reductase [Secundilactobacillus similis]|uniref:NADPH-dependent FMN reductase n=1 Tax=Secundilactobacillus similis TaxID=414682 RepID=UPI001CDB2668|nr:NAD(P)H-dependent oxidoreductase [Secundilactobacillus similis]
MKLIGLVGNNASQSYNRILLQYMARHFGPEVEIEVREIQDLPLFNEDIHDAPAVSWTWQLQSKPQMASSLRHRNTITRFQLA